MENDGGGTKATAFN